MIEMLIGRFYLIKHKWFLHSAEEFFFPRFIDIFKFSVRFILLSLTMPIALCFSGHGKFETLGALGISTMLLATAGGIAWHALDILAVSF